VFYLKIQKRGDVKVSNVTCGYALSSAAIELPRIPAFYPKKFRNIPHRVHIKGAVALSGSLFAKKNKSRASQSPALGVRFKYEQKQNLTERLYLIFSVLSNQTSTGS
jgi:hypothetical protein